METTPEITAPVINTWTHPNGSVRRYIENALELAGLDIERYRSGSIRRAVYRGQYLSNTRAGILEGTRVWLDGTNRVHVDRFEAHQMRGIITQDELTAGIIEALAVAGMTVTAAA